jgi:hypothetical protein
MPKGGVVVLGKKGRADDPNSSLSLTVPYTIVAEAKLEPGMRFRAEITDEGILYRPVAVPPMEDPRPAWRRQEGAES